MKIRQKLGKNRLYRLIEEDFENCSNWNRICWIILSNIIKPAQQSSGIVKEKVDNKSYYLETILLMVH